MDSQSDLKISQLSTRTLYKNRWMSLREDAVRFPGGHEGIYSVVEKPDFATIIPVHDDGRIQLVQQYRYPVGGRYWELPQGAWEDNPDADPIKLAKGELEEETGFRALEWEKLGSYFNSYGVMNQTCHLFIARKLTEGVMNREETEADMETAAFTMDEILAMIRRGEIPDTITIAALGYWRLMQDTSL